MMMRLLLVWCIAAFLLTACGQVPASAPPSGRTPVSRPSPPPAEIGQLAVPRPSDPAKLPLLAARNALVALALAGPVPVIALAGLTGAPQAAQDLALGDARVRQAVFTADGQPMRAEVFGVYPLGPADQLALGDLCAGQDCYRVEIYNFANNATIIVIADPAAGAVRAVSALPDTQPTVVPQALMDLAAQIALAAPEVREALGPTPDAAMIQQPQMKVQFQATACERSRHLCSAPIFVWGERALWVIVDLVDYTVIGLRWTELGASSRRPISEQRLQDTVVTARYCDQPSELAQAGWSLRYLLTSSDGLLIEDVRFNGVPVLRSAKLVDVHISYSSREGFGYSDALGCPAFSAAAVVAWNGPSIEPLVAGDGGAGFALVQRFRSEFWPTPCNYAYVQRYEFYADGRFRVVFVSEGRGCGNDGTYRPLLRIALAGEQLGFSAWDGRGWQGWPTEGWRLQAKQASTPEGYQYRLADGIGGGWYLAPGATDNAYLYLSQQAARRDEGLSDLPTLGDCCNSDERQGPDRFVTPAEPLGDGPLVLWYVPQLRNSDQPGAQRCWADAALEGGVFVPQVWPCAAGPLFVPYKE